MLNDSARENVNSYYEIILNFNGNSLISKYVNLYVSSDLGKFSFLYLIVLFLRMLFLQQTVVVPEITMG